MTLWTVLLGAVVLLGLVVSLLPLFRARRPWLDEDDATSQLDPLFEAKARVLRTIKDLDHEHAAGLLVDADWREARAEAVAEAVRLNREIAARTGVDPVEAETVA